MTPVGGQLRTQNGSSSRDLHKLLLVLPSLGGGGAERASIDLLRGIRRDRFEPSLALFAHSGPFLKQVPADVRVHDLHGQNQYDARLVWRLSLLLRHEKPDIILSVLRYANLITLLARPLSGAGARVVVNEQNLPSAEFAAFGGAAVKGWALKELYPRADLVTAISHGIARELTSLYGLPEEKVEVICNPVDVARVLALAEEPTRHAWLQSGPGASDAPVLMAAGRLHRQKGFPHLIRAFAAVRRVRPCKLVILGEGPDRSRLEKLVVGLGLCDDVALPGFDENPYSAMRHATAFVLSSLYEGFGNVLVEALAVGTPVVSTRCPVGPDEIITDGVTGLLVPPADDEALAQSILRILDDSELRRKLSANGPARAADFGLERSVAQYESAFERLLDRPQPMQTVTRGRQ